MSEQQSFTFDGHAIFEAMGHIKRVGNDADYGYDSDDVSDVSF